MSTVDYDVVVVGAGNAGLVAALTAHEAGARVVVLEAAGYEERGGNSRFSGSIFRAVHTGWIRSSRSSPSPAESGMDRVYGRPVSAPTLHRRVAQHVTGAAARQLVETVVDRSFETLAWMRDHGVEWELTVSKLFDPASSTVFTTYRPAGRSGCGMKGWASWLRSSRRSRTPGSMSGTTRLRPTCSRRARRSSGCRSAGRVSSTRSAVRSCWRAEDSRPIPRCACATSVRAGTSSRYGAPASTWAPCSPRPCLAGAQPAGHWGGCHASPQDAAHPPVGDLRLTDKLSRYSFPYSLLINPDGHRFVDEGEDEVWLTYAKTGGAILAQKGGPWLIRCSIRRRSTSWNRVTAPGRRSRPRPSRSSPTQLGVPAGNLTATVAAFNEAVAADAEVRFDPLPSTAFRREPEGQPVKSNWALALDKGPFVAYPVTCGITFTYGGLKIDCRRPSHRRHRASHARPLRDR